ncbi:hypothetical protein PQR71_42150 [Paraburkholderia fungorum]|uniref:hypothetical protein n=1 Tax=Paraburkholderia fungorum TaxID=134537 RepID=UPI0038B7F07A
MPKPTMPRITEYLTGRPNGAAVRKIAEVIDSTSSSTIQTLRRMYSRGQLMILADTNERDDMIWALANTSRVMTPPIFRAMETLTAFQEAARQKLINVPALEVA